MEFYDPEFLSALGDKIGKTLKVDLTTTLQTRGKFARLCVQVDLDNPLLANYKLKGRYMKIEYEGIHLICFSCGKYGHGEERCPYLIRPPGPVPHADQDVNLDPKSASKEKDDSSGKNAEESSKIQIPPQDAQYGPCMLVTRPRRPRRVAPASYGNQEPVKQGKPDQDPPKIVQPVQHPSPKAFGDLSSDNQEKNNEEMELGTSPQMLQQNPTQNNNDNPKVFLTRSQMKRERAGLANANQVQS